MLRLINRIKVMPAWFLVLIGLSLVAAIGFLDYLTEDYSLLIFYAIPVGLIAWLLGDKGALIISLAAGFARYISDYYSYSPSDFRYWTSIEDMLFLLIAGLVLSAVKRLLDLENKEKCQ
jgi:purine-cytosine permease-like protein